jgi:MFS family permease
MTGFALTLWLYEQTGSALSTAALTICTYAPYVIMSIFAGAISDRYDKKNTMLTCDALAAFTTILVFVLYRTDALSIWHLYAINAFSGLMNTVQQPASEVAYTLIVPKEQYQRTSGLQSLSRSLVSIGNPLLAAALYGTFGLDAVIIVDLTTFGIAFLSLLFFIFLPDIPVDSTGEKKHAGDGKGGLGVS